MSENLKPEAPRPERRGLRWTWWLAGLLVIVGAAWLTADQWMPAEETAAEEAELSTAEVVRTDLVEEESYDGTLESLGGETIPAPVAGVVSYAAAEGSIVEPGQILFEVDGEPVIVLSGAVPAHRDFTLGDDLRQLISRASGTLTWLAPVGTVLEEGDVIAEVDGEPIVLLYGDVPAYRRLFDARTDLEGDDILQLEEALVRLGVDPDGEMEVDAEFDATTAEIVEAWQESIGAVADGAVDLGEVVFLPGPAQVIAPLGEIGERVGDGSLLLRIATGDPLSGDDVAQLEQALLQLGYLAIADDTFDSRTADAIKALQAATGATETGVFSALSVLFTDLSVRIDDVIAGVGSAVTPNAPVLEVASTELVVRMALPASDQGLLLEGQSVTVELPNGDEITGVVASVATVATRLQGAEASFEVIVALSDPAAAAGFEDAPVDVEVVSDSVEDVLAVPVTALLALAEGGYAVEVVEGSSSRLVGVDPGFFARGMVEVTGNLTVGDVVVVP